MLRECTRCRRPFAPADLDREESRGMESGRKEAGLLGVRFLYYRCPGCAAEDIFIDIVPREGESPDEYTERHAAMQTAARGMHAGVDVVVTPVKPPADAALGTELTPPG